MSDQVPTPVPGQTEEISDLFAQLRPQDVEHFYRGYRLWSIQRKMQTLQIQIDALKEGITDNRELMVAEQPSPIALATLAQFQACGVEDVDLLDRMNQRGEAWLDHTLQLLLYCERFGVLRSRNYTEWCEHALEGAYDWVASAKQAESVAPVAPETPVSDVPVMPAPEEPELLRLDEDTTEALLLQKLMSEGDETLKIPALALDRLRKKTQPLPRITQPLSLADVPIETSEEPVLSAQDTVEIPKSLLVEIAEVDEVAEVADVEEIDQDVVDLPLAVYMPVPEAGQEQAVVEVVVVGEPDEKIDDLAPELERPSDEVVTPELIEQAAVGEISELVEQADQEEMPELIEPAEMVNMPAEIEDVPAVIEQAEPTDIPEATEPVEIVAASDLVEPVTVTATPETVDPAEDVAVSERIATTDQDTIDIDLEDLPTDHLASINVQLIVPEKQEVQEKRGDEDVQDAPRIQEAEHQELEEVSSLITEENSVEEIAELQPSAQPTQPLQVPPLAWQWKELTDYEAQVAALHAPAPANGSAQPPAEKQQQEESPAPRPGFWRSLWARIFRRNL